MPVGRTRSLSDVPPPSRSSRKTRDKQATYNELIKLINNGDVGDLEPVGDETIRSIKMSLARTANRLGIGIEVWDANGHVYFRKGQGRRRPRPRSLADIQKYGTAEAPEITV